MTTEMIVYQPQPLLLCCPRQTTTCLSIPKKTQHFCFNQWLQKWTNLRKKSKRKRRSLFVNEDKSNASILHAITISLTATICKIFPEKGDHLTPHLWPSPVSPLGALRNRNVSLHSGWTQMLKKAVGITKTSQSRSHTVPVTEKVHYSN